MTHSFNFQDIAARETLWNFFFPDAPTLFTGETVHPGVFSQEVRQRLDQTLSSLTDGAEGDQPVALWFTHLDRGDDMRSSTSRLHAVLFLHDDKLVARKLSELPTAQQSAVLETLGAFFLSPNLCEDIYQHAEYNIMHPLDVVHFKEFSLFIGQPGNCDSTDFEEQLEDLGFHWETQGLRTCVHAGCSRETEAKQLPKIERAMELIHGANLR